MASTTAQRRLLQEYRALTNNPPEGITAGPVSEDDLLYWEALIQGPEGTPFEGGVFPAELKFPKDYPLAPPSMRFLGEVWHPNGRSRVHSWILLFPGLGTMMKDGVDRFELS
jgi:ubiquitin-conjugating enzyme E2 G2